MPGGAKEAIYLLSVDDGTKSAIGKARGHLARAAVSIHIVRVFHFNNKRVPLGHYAEASDQLAVGEVLRTGSSEPHVDVEVVAVVGDQAVPAAVHTGPINRLAAKALHVRVVTHVCPGWANCVVCIGMRGSRAMVQIMQNNC